MQGAEFSGGDLGEDSSSAPRTGWGLLDAVPREAICSYPFVMLLISGSSLKPLRQFHGDAPKLRRLVGVSHHPANAKKGAGR